MIRKSSRALAAFLALGVTLAHAQPRAIIRIRPGFAASIAVPGAAAGNFKAIIGDPKIADMTFGPKNLFWFLGLKEGVTNIIVVNENTGVEMYSALIEVDAGASPGRIQVHNKSLLTSFTVYRCNPRCAYVNEVTAAEPAPLPRGHVSRQEAWSVQQSIQSNAPAQPLQPSGP